MNRIKDNPVCLNLRDSVERMILNMGFTSAESKAFHRLVDLLVLKLNQLTRAAKTVAEKSGKIPKDVNVLDVVCMFKMNGISIDELSDYMTQVRPFPPTPDEIHDYPTQIEESVSGTCISNAGDKVAEVEESVAIKEELVPNFEGMSDFELGFTCFTPEPAPKQKGISSNLGRIVSSNRIITPSARKNKKVVDAFNNNNETAYTSGERKPKISKSAPNVALSIDNTSSNRNTSLVTSPSIWAVPRVPKDKKKSIVDKKSKVNNNIRLKKSSGIQKQHIPSKYEVAKKADNGQKEKLSVKIPVKVVKHDDTQQEAVDLSFLNKSSDRYLKCEVDEKAEKVVLRINKSAVQVIKAEKERIEEERCPLSKFRIKYKSIPNGITVERVSVTKYRKEKNEWKPTKMSKSFPKPIPSYFVPNIFQKRPKLENIAKPKDIPVDTVTKKKFPKLVLKKLPSGGYRMK